jgi:hypothetical protein
MGKDKDARSIATSGAGNHQMVCPGAAARNPLDGGAGVDITFGDARHQLINALNIGRLALYLDPLTYSIENAPS